jgi:tape measure domain-containing protein
MTKNEVKILLTAINAASDELEKAKKDIEGLGTEADKASKGGLAAIDKKLRDANDASRTFAAGIALIGAAIAATVGTGIKLAADQEQAQIAFTNMLGSAEEAKDFLEGLADFAANTPFEMHGLRDASKLLLAFGFQAEDILPIMTSVGDAVAAVGGGEFEIQRVVRALGQMQAKGKVSAEEMMQLAELGIPAWQLLADKIGVSIPEAMKLAEKGVITGAEGIEAIVDGLEEKFGGMMQAQSQTLAGLFSTLKDEASLTLMAIGQDLVEAFNVDDLLRDAIEAVHSIREAVEAEGLVGLLEEHRVAIIIVAGAITGALIPAFYSMAAAAVAAAVALAPFLIGGAVIAGIIALQTELAKSDSWDTFVSNANRSKEAIEGLTKVTTEQGLIEAAELLSSTLKGKAKEGFDQFFDDTIRQVLAQEGLQAALLLTKKYSAEMLAQANADAAKAQNAILTAQISQATADLNAAKFLDKLIPNDANIAKYEARLESLRDQQLATIPVIAAYYDTNADLEGGLIDSGTATQRWIDSLINFKATALAVGPTIAELPFLETGEKADEAADGVNNLGTTATSTAKQIKTVTDVLTGYQEQLALINREQAERGDGFDGLVAQLRLEQQIYKELLAMNAPAELTQQFADSIAKLEELTSETKLTVEIEATFDAEKAAQIIHEAAQNAPGVARGRAITSADSEATAEEQAALRIQQANWIKNQSFVTGAEARYQAYLENEKSANAEAEAEEKAALRIQQAAWLADQGNEMPGVARGRAAEAAKDAAEAAAQAEEQAQQRILQAQYIAQQGVLTGVQLRYQAYLDNAKAADAEATAEEQAQQRILQARIHQQNPLPGPSNSTQAGGYFSQIAGESIDYADALAYAESAQQALNNAIEQANTLMGVAPNKVQLQVKSLETLKEQYPELGKAIDEIIEKLEDFGEQQDQIKGITDVLGGVIAISSAIGDSFDGEFGKAADAIAETAEVALNAVKAIASGDPIAIAAAAIQAIGFIASEIAEATKDNIKAAAEEIDAQYELIGEATAKGLAEANKKKETRYFLFIPYQVEVPDQPALDAAVQITNTFAQGLLDGLGGTEEEFQKWLEDWIDQLILQSIIAAQDLSEITKIIQDALADDGIIDEEERKRIQGMADSIRDSVIAAAEGAGITFDKDVDGSLAAWRKELQKLRDQLDQTEVGTADFNDLLRQIEELENRIAAATGNANNPSDPKPTDSSQEMDFSNIPPAIQFAVATPLVEAANTFLFGVDKLIDFLDGEMTIAGGSADLDSFATSITRFDNATIRFEDSVDRWVDEGLRIMLEYPDDRQTETPRSLTRSFRSR